MILTLPVLLSLLIAVLRGGDLLALAEVRFRHSWLILLGLLIQIVIFSPWWASIPDCVDWTHEAYCLSMAVLLVPMWLNRSLPGMAFLGIGLFLNALTIWANGGQMPASLWALQTSGLLPSGDAVASWQSNNSALMNESTRLWFLCDIFAVPRSWPLANMFSIGDVLIGLGGVVFIQRSVVPSSRESA